MKFKRFMMKVLRLKVIIPTLIVIAVVILILCYFVGGLKASTLDTNKNNIEFNIEDFESFEDKIWDADGDGKFDMATDGPLIETGMYSEYLTQNDKYIMYFDEATTIATIYEKKEADIGTTIPEASVDTYVQDCRSFQTADYRLQADGANNKDAGANLIVYYSNQSSGVELDPVNSMENSVYYKNPLTEEIEHHYFINKIEDGVQIMYAIGKFSAGEDYFPQKMLQTVYKPYNGVGSKYANDAEAYNIALENWIEYMENLGLADPLEASQKEIDMALSQTFEQRFRGNALFVNKKTETSSSIQIDYSGTVYVYSYESFEYIKNLIETGVIEGELPELKTAELDDGTEVEYYKMEYSDASSIDSATKYFKYGNACWKFTNISENFFEGNGVYFNCDDSPIIVNTSIPSLFYINLMCKIAYTVGSDTDLKWAYFNRGKLQKSYKSTLYNMLYMEGEFYDYVSGKQYIDKNGDPFIAGGYYGYDEDGNVEHKFYTLEQVANDNTIFDIESSTSLGIFGVCLELKLGKYGLEATILGDSLIDYTNASSHNDFKLTISGAESTISASNKNFVLTNIVPLNQMTTIENYDAVNNPTGDEGYMIIPDGSGAIINFNNKKYDLNYAGVSKAYYGSEKTFVSRDLGEEEKDLMLGMFGFICTTPGNERGVIGILGNVNNPDSNPGNDARLTAWTTNTKSYAYFKVNVREVEQVQVGKSSGARYFSKLAKNLNPNDIQFTFIFLNKEELDYSTVAKKYQAYLIERDGLTLKDETNNTVVDLDFLGSFEKYALFLGFKYKTADSLTTFSQAEDIISELKSGVEVEDGSVKKIQDYSVSFKAWTSEEMEYQVGGSMTVSSQLGGNKGLKEFVEYLNNDGKTVYLEQYVTTTHDYDYSYGSIKYSARSVANNVASNHVYLPNTLKQDKKLSKTFYINPLYYMNITNYIIGKMEKLDGKVGSKLGYFLIDLGDLTIANYKKDEEVYGVQSIKYQKEALENIANTQNDVKIKAPYDYAFKYVTEATNVPLKSTSLPIYDETIPFYQLVVSGLFDYSTEDINGNSNNSAKWFFAKAIETGSNLSFVISAENPNVLLDTDYTMYYQAYYQNWKEQIVSMASEIDSLGIHTGELVEHKAINLNGDVAYVVYKVKGTNDLIKLYVNTTENDYVYDDGTDVVTIPSYSYYKLG